MVFAETFALVIHNAPVKAGAWTLRTLQAFPGVGTITGCTISPRLAPVGALEPARLTICLRDPVVKTMTNVAINDSPVASAHAVRNWTIIAQTASPLIPAGATTGLCINPSIPRAVYRAVTSTALFAAPQTLADTTSAIWRRLAIIAVESA